jgi:hypothetical protein
LNTDIYIYDEDVWCTTLTHGGPQEEGWEEYAAYHQGAGSGHEEAHIESGVLEEKGASFGPGIEGQSLGAGAGARGEARGTVPLCEETTSSGCARYAFSLGEAWGWAKHLAKKVWHKAVALVHLAIDKQAEAADGPAAEPYRSNVANACEATAFTTLVAPLPTGAFGKFVSVFIWGAC